ncbi:MAG: helicase, partial [Candidatus Wildermuthbacteria bacterium]|nr:helicase [Candidatus Wildermuthbacteria bacterium]
AGPEPLVESLKRGCLSPELLRLKAGAAVMFTKNNAKEGFVNGSVGVVERMEHVRKNPIVKITGLGRIEVERMEWRIEEEGKIKAEVSQLPLRLVWAITVHKSQGMSMDEAVMDLSGVFEYGQGYVALSRVRRLSGLHLLGWNEQTFKVHPKVLEKDREFRKMSEEILLFFAKMPPVEILQMHENFIRSCGGKSLSLSAVSAMNPKRKRERGRK